MRWVDSHAHLDFHQFDGDRAAVVERAREAGLVAIINVGTDLASSRAAIELAEEYAFIYATVGVHPHNASKVKPAVLGELRELAQHPKVVAIGEVGLDYYRNLSPQPAQRQAFADQLALAQELDLPVVIHSREAQADLMDVLRGWQGRGVFHAYAGGPEWLEETLAMGFFVGFSGVVTFHQARALRQVAATIKLEQLLVETDCPYLTPEPHRGKRNEPAYVRYAGEGVARARGVAVETVAQAALENAVRLFGISV